MRFDFNEIATIPRMAWCAQITDDNPAIMIYHGVWVEIGEDYFCEGAWNGDFSAGDFPNAYIFAGSGAKITKDGALFVSSTNTVEKLHLMRVDNWIMVSNSLAFLLTKAGDSIDKNYSFYVHDLFTIIKGLKKYKKWIPTLFGNKVYVYYHCNVLIDSNLMVKTLAKDSPDPFVNYADYRRFLQVGVSAIHRNATASPRKVKYQPLSTISSGYDSPACSVLAMEIGCSEAVTFTHARPTFTYTEDGGAKIGELLGFRVTAFDREEYLRKNGFPEAEFLAAGTLGEDVVMAALEEILPKKLLFTGYHGDKVWDPNNQKVGPNIIRGDASGTSLAEFRLRLGFIHLPVPFIGCIHHPSIHAISNSAELRPWSTGNDYDRPIPRRICEDYGIPRNLFGQQKKAITQPFSQPLDTIMSEESYRDFMDFADSISIFRNVRHHAFFVFMQALYHINCQINRVVAAIFKRFCISLVKEPIISEKFKEPPKLSVLTFHWGLDKIKTRYVIPRAL